MRDLVVVAALVAAGCVDGGPWEEPEGADRGAIVGGGVEAGFETTGALVVDHGAGSGSIYCSAVAVTPTVVVSAAHCLDGFDDTGGDPVVFLLRTASGGVAYRTDASTRRNHPSWPDHEYDVGVFTLRSPVPTTIFPYMRRAAVTSAEIGTALVAVGYGETSPDAGDAGTKRSVPMNIASTAGPYFVVRHPESWRGVCHGDSGGPSFVAGPLRDTLFGVHARTQDLTNCGPGEDTSVGDLYSSFLEGAILALDPAAQSCGDGLCTGVEASSECPADCLDSSCGDGAQEDPEVCDDGNTVSGDGCSADCMSDETCGNGVVDDAVGELCDDGNTADGDGCSGDCSSAEGCGNGVVDDAAGEVCDDGNTADGDGCSADCLSDETCGNGVVDAVTVETCDDGNRDSGDGCSADCLSDETCGNRIIDTSAGEVCDDGNTADGDGCSADCAVAEGCGNGVVEEDRGEVCDDGNTEGGDGCSAGCRSDETCGNGVVDVDAGEWCDDGNDWDDDGCPSDCRQPDDDEDPPDGTNGGCDCAVAGATPGGQLRLLLRALLP